MRERLFSYGYGQYGAASAFPEMASVTYILSAPYTNGAVKLTTQPFGAATSANGGPYNPIQLAKVSKYGSLSDIYAVSDVDAKLAGDWLNEGEATTPNHGNIHNALYFDGHVKAYKGTNFISKSIQPAVE
jgi:prepilin-type processing-associated H-X9-DG protein